MLLVKLSELHLQVAAAFLFNLKGFEERFEITFAEALATHATDDLEEHRGAILQRLGEELSNCVLG